MTFTPTPEQLEIIQFAQNRTENLAVVARAGAAKTSTLVLVAEALPSVKILCLAFNKAIATEMAERLPSNCTSKTLHSLGYGAWREFTRKKIKLDGRKLYFLLREEFDKLGKEVVEEEELFERFSEILDHVKRGKQQGWLPESYSGHWKPLVTDEEFWATSPTDPTPLEIQLVEKVSRTSFAQALEGTIDFDDMVFCPALCSVSWPSFPLVLVDESQDLSALNHHILKKLVRNKRLIAVGDPCQPLGTQITKVIKKGDRWNEPKLKQVAIEDIQVGDTVLGHNANGSFMYNRKVEGITRKPFSGELVVAGPTKYTPNHHCYTRFASLKNHWCVYLMKKGAAYRIGKSRMNYGEQGLGPQIRAKAEGADAMWILSTFEDEQSAFIAEAVIQAEFGLSDLCFVDPARPWLALFWCEMQTLDLESRAIACLEAYHRNIDYPLWQAGDSIPAKRPFITRACNLLNGCELMPYKGDKKTGKTDWTPITITYEPYDGDVISFTISDNHLYVADNIVTHNCQAIYGFRGADSKSMENMMRKFSMEELRLTVSFRCARKITENAQWRAYDMKAPEWANEGEVHRPVVWDFAEIRDGDAIICRNNAPLFSMAIKLIEHDKLPTIAGQDIGAPLVKLMKKLGKSGMLSGVALEAIKDWEEKELKRARKGAKGAIHDKANIIRIMLRRTATLGDAIAYLEHLLQRDGRIHLMTGHKSKGLEFDRVWFLDQKLCNPEYEQDLNLKYVIETRAKNFLTYINSDGAITGEGDD